MLAILTRGQISKAILFHKKPEPTDFRKGKTGEVEEEGRGEGTERGRGRKKKGAETREGLRPVTSVVGDRGYTTVKPVDASTGG